jgi:hypothetical protein
MRRLPGPADCRLSEGDQPPETANGCLVLPGAGTYAERHTVRIEHPGTVDLHALASVPRDTRPSALTDDLHGGRLSGS